MASDLSGAISRLADSAKQLNYLTDEASSAVAHVEELLAQLSIGIETYVPIEEGSNKFLGYVRTGKERIYRITLSGQSGKGTPWDELPRDEKIEAISALPRLILRLSQQIDERIARADSALNELKQILPVTSKGGI